MGCHSAHFIDFGNADNASCADYLFYSDWLLLTFQTLYFVTSSKFKNLNRSPFSAASSCPYLKINLASSSSLV